MKIIPLRTMRLGGEHVEQGKPVEVDKAEADRAIRHGWAVAAPGKAKPADKPAEQDAA